MATKYSDQRANDVAYPPVPNNANTGGRTMKKWFSLNTTDTPVSNGDVVELCKLPAKARVVGGYLVRGAMGASATAIIGVSGSTSKYMASEDMSAAGTETFADVEAENFGAEVPAEGETVILTAGGADYAAAKNILGYIEYISAGE